MCYHSFNLIIRSRDSLEAVSEGLTSDQIILQIIRRVIRRVGPWHHLIPPDITSDTLEVLKTAYLDDLMILSFDFEVRSVEV